jgi:chaperonin GroEL
MVKEVERRPTTRVVFSGEARKELYAGLETTAEAVSCTFGPKGKTVLIQNAGAAPIVTKDGVTVSKSINLKDPLKRMGSELIREAASRTNDVAGDGTTTSTVLTHAMVKSGLKLLEAGYSSQDLCTGIDLGVKTVLEDLRSSARQLTTSEELVQIGTISANGDVTIGKLIATAMEKVGRDGIITVEDAKGMSTSLEIVEGMQFDRGYVSPYFVNNQEKMSVVFHDAKVLLTDKKISTLREIIPILEKVNQSRCPLLIIAEDIEGEALQGLVVNRLNANLQIVAVKAPGYGKHKDELLNDISVLTGAKLVSSKMGTKFETTGLSDLGTLKKVVVDAKSSTLVATGTTKQAVEQHVGDLKHQLSDVSLTMDEVTKLKVRIAKLASGVAVIRVGGTTEIEMIEKKYRIEDALNATRAAADEGIVPGGGMALFNASESIDRLLDSASQGVKAGLSIVKDACHAPIRRIASNAGQSPEVTIKELERLEQDDKRTLGYDALNDTFVDMLKTGIIDPVKVTRTALKNAASVTTTFLSLDAVVVEEEDNNGR